MKLVTQLLVCALALAAVTDAADTVRRECGDGGVDTPLPTTLAPVTDKPGQTTPTPTPTPTPTTATPPTITPAPNATTPAPATTTPAPATTTPVPSSSKPTKFDKNQEYTREGIDCAGYLRLPPPGQAISKQDCVLDYSVKFSKASEEATNGCVVCEPKWGKFVFDNSVPLASQEVPLCGGLPLCTRLRDYGMLTELDLMCVLSQNGAAPIEDPNVCGFGDN
jgi:hypothetical protein